MGAKEDCSKFDPATKNLTGFFKKAKKSVKGIMASISCFKDAILLIPDLKVLYTELAKWIGGAIASVAGSVIGNLATMGVWAGIKAAYYIVKLGIKIYKFIKTWQ